jgi:hypothetical protein
MEGLQEASDLRESEHAYGDDQEQEGGNDDRRNEPSWISRVL